MADNFNSRSEVAVPEAVASDIIQGTQEASAVMHLARQVILPGGGVAVNVITSDPEAGWVAEGAKKPVKKAGVSSKKLAAYKLAVIVPFSIEFTRDAASLYQAIVKRLPGALAAKFDNTVFGGTTAPGELFDQMTKVGDVNISTDPYAALVDADAAISEADAMVNGYVLSPAARAVMLKAVDGNKRPLFNNSVAENGVPVILGAPTYMSRGAKAGDGVGYMGDWTKSVYGSVQGVNVSISDQATLTLEDGSTINLWQQNMVAIRAEIECGFRADLTAFRRLVNKTA